MSATRSAYPSRPPAMRPKKPNKGTGKPSSHSGGRKSKTWVSLRDVVSNNMDMSPRRQSAWWQSPMYVEARTKKWERINGA